MVSATSWLLCSNPVKLHLLSSVEEKNDKLKEQGEENMEQAPVEEKKLNKEVSIGKECAPQQSRKASDYTNVTKSIMSDDYDGSSISEEFEDNQVQVDCK